MEDARAVTVYILDKEYRIACEPEMEAELLASARLLDRRMREVRATGKVIGSDRIAVMAALNLAHELISRSQAQDEMCDSASQRLRVLHERIESALNESKGLEV